MEGDTLYTRKHGVHVLQDGSICIVAFNAHLTCEANVNVIWKNTNSKPALIVHIFSEANDSNPALI